MPETESCVNKVGENVSYMQDMAGRWLSIEFWFN